MSATPDSTLVNPEQRIADLERQLAECKAELAERDAELAAALDRETATAQVLGVINASPGDLKPVFEAILEKAHQVCGAIYGALALYDGEYFRAVATRGLPKEMVEVVTRPFRGNAYHQQLVGGERYIHIADTLALATEELGDVGKASSAAGVRTSLLMPSSTHPRSLTRPRMPTRCNSLGVAWLAH